MYEGLTANTPGCVAFSLLVQRRNLRCQEIPASFRSLPSQRSARLRWSGGFEPERRPVPGYHLGTSQFAILVRGRLQTRQNRLPGRKASTNDDRQVLRRCAGPSATDKAALCRQRVQTGRRLMRQTVLPTMIQGNAPTRSESCARRLTPRGSRSAGRPGLRFGLPLTPESGGPSRHPAARHARTAIRARRREELPNAQQNANRCHPPGRNPGRRGPRQSRRGI